MRNTGTARTCNLALVLGSCPVRALSSRYLLRFANEKMTCEGRGYQEAAHRGAIGRF